MQNKIIVAAVALIAVFLVGFIPQYVKVNRLESELRQSRQDAAGAEIRELIGLAYVQASQRPRAWPPKPAAVSSTGSARWRTKRRTRTVERPRRICLRCGTR